jgi:hypothetical protein
MAEITHVFVLMLENHSYIFASSGIPGIKAAALSDKNSYNGRIVPAVPSVPNT